MSKSPCKKSKRVGRQACVYLLQRQSTSGKNSRHADRQISFVSSERGDDSLPTSCLGPWRAVGLSWLSSLSQQRWEQLVEGDKGGSRKGRALKQPVRPPAAQSGEETPWTVAHQAPLSMGFSRQEQWRGWPRPSPRDLPNPGIEPASPALHADSLPLSHQGSPVERVPRGKNSNNSLCFSARSCPTQPFASNNLYRTTRMNFLKAGILLVPCYLHNKYLLNKQLIFLYQITLCSLFKMPIFEIISWATFFSRQFPIFWIKLMPEADSEPTKEVWVGIWVGSRAGIPVEEYHFDHNWNCNFYNIFAGSLGEVWIFNKCSQ